MAMEYLTRKHMLALAVVAMVLQMTMTTTSAFEWHAPGQRPEVTRQAIAGLWKLTPALRPKYPMKEFTVHPPKKQGNEDDKEPELLLMLKEDGSFQEYASDEVTADEESVEDSWKRYQKKQRQEKRKAELAALAKGTWDYRDGKLILAADRPSTSPEAPKTKNKEEKLSKQWLDKILEGRVVATYETSLPDNPVLDNNVANTTAATVTEGRSSTKMEKQWDTHLAVPKGSVKVGKFFYPKHHPSFFDQPIYNPSKLGAFQLRQILGSLNTNVHEEDKSIEKFQRADFYNKTFLLTSHPLGLKKPKGSTRWSIKQNKFVQDPPSSKAAKEYAEDMENRSANIRVMQVRFFQNNTFATIWGTGDSILRGKFDVIGQDKDSLWMTISRFGFGRSVSGSVFSEGRMLSQDDAKSYWGTIRFQSNNDNDEEKEEESNTAAPPPMSQDNENEPGKKLEVRGSVLFGGSLEPTPVGRFIMREADDDFDSLFDEDDEEDDEEEDAEVALPDISSSLSDTFGEEGVDLSSDDAFQ